MKRSLFALLLVTVALAGVNAQTEQKRIERLSELAKVWGTAKFFHPYLAYKEIDWDRALIETIPKVDSANTSDEYAAALNAMLAALGDGSSRASIVSEGSPTVSKSDPTESLRFDGGVLFYNALAAAREGAQDPHKAVEFTENLRKFLPQSKAMIVDSRMTGEPDEFVQYLAGEHIRQTLTTVLDQKITLGTSRYRMHSGYAPQIGTTSGGYFSALSTETPEGFGSDAEKPFKTPQIVLIVERSSPFAKLFSGLQSAGKALVVGDSDELVGSFYTMKLANKVQVALRVDEIINPDGSVGFVPDAVAPKGAEIETARRIIAKEQVISNRPKGSVVNASQFAQRDKTYAEMQFPSRGYRLLALFRFWNVINYFFPYKDLIGSDWDTILPKYIPKLEANVDAADYEMTVREMIAETHDSHVGVRNANASSEKIGTYLPPISVRFIEGQTVVVKVLDDKLPVKIGDVILSVDGEDIGKRRDYFERVTSGSTPQALMRNVHNNILRGQKDTTAKITLRGADGKMRTIEARRGIGRMDPKLQTVDERTTPIFAILPSGFGYVDLDRLQSGETGKMFDALKNAPAIIFDMRGYPNGTAWSIGPRLSDKKMPVAALFSRPILEGNSLSSSDFSGAPLFTFSQPIPPRGDAEIYRGKVVMLIDEYAQSQSEHTALFFETARPDMAFIGTPTAGANGDVTVMVLPGNLIVSFSGHSVRHADGRQLQRLGIQPTVRVAPTIKGLRAGKDEILEAAIKYLQKKR